MWMGHWWQPILFKIYCFYDQKCKVQTKTRQTKYYYYYTSLSERKNCWKWKLFEINHFSILSFFVEIIFVIQLTPLWIFFGRGGGTCCKSILPKTFLPIKIWPYLFYTIFLWLFTFFQQHKTRYWNNSKRGTADQLWLKKKSWQLKIDKHEGQ